MLHCAPDVKAVATEAVNNAGAAVDAVTKATPETAVAALSNLGTTLSTLIVADDQSGTAGRTLAIKDTI